MWQCALSLFLLGFLSQGCLTMEVLVFDSSVHGCFIFTLFRQEDGSRVIVHWLHEVCWRLGFSIAREAAAICVLVRLWWLRVVNCRRGDGVTSSCFFSDLHLVVKMVELMELMKRRSNGGSRFHLRWMRGGCDDELGWLV